MSPGEMNIQDNFQRSNASERIQGLVNKSAEVQQENAREAGKTLAQQKAEQTEDVKNAENKDVNPDGKGGQSNNYQSTKGKKKRSPKNKRRPAAGSSLVDIDAWKDESYQGS